MKFAFLVLWLALGVGAQAATISELRAALASGQDPYAVLKNLYDTAPRASTYDDFDLFGKPSNVRCASVYAAGGEVTAFDPLKKYPITQPARGPLFPAKTTYKLISALIDKTYDGFKSYYGTDEQLKTTLDDTTMTLTPQELVFHIVGGGLDTTASFRSAGDLDAIKVTGLDSTNVNYAYCWREGVMPSASLKKAVRK